MNSYCETVDIVCILNSVYLYVMQTLLFMSVFNFSSVCIYRYYYYYFFVLVFLTWEKVSF